MKKSSAAGMLLPALLVTSLAIAAAAPVSPELCRAGVSCATENLWRQESFELVPRAGGAPYVIQISLPASPAPATGYPVVYLLDAGTTFGTLADIAHYQELFFVPTVVVGVRYPDPFEVQRRGDDLLPPGAEPFITFLVQDLRAELARRVKIDTARQALFGHSLSGLFTLYVAFTRPEAFDTYVAGDPSIGMGGYRIVQRVPQLRERGFAVSRRLLLTRGTANKPEEAPEVMRFAKKQNIPPPKPPVPGEYSVSLAEFAQMLKPIKGLDVTLVEFPDETHQSMIPAHLGRGMRWTMMGWDPP